MVQVETFQEDKDRPVLGRKMPGKTGRSESMGRLKREKSIDLQLEQKIDMITGFLSHVSGTTDEIENIKINTAKLHFHSGLSELRGQMKEIYEVTTPLYSLDPGPTGHQREETSTQCHPQVRELVLSLRLRRDQVFRLPVAAHQVHP